MAMIDTLETAQDFSVEIPAKVKTDQARAKIYDRRSNWRPATDMPPCLELTAEVLNVPQHVLDALNYEGWVYGPRATLSDFLGQAIYPTGGRLYYYTTVEKAVAKSRNRVIEAYQKEVDKMLRQQAHRASDQALHKQLELGAVFYSMWGYDQTNVDFYELVGKSGAQTLILRRLKADTTDTGGPEGGVTSPLVGNFAGPEFRARLSRGHVRVDQGQTAQPADFTRVGGTKVYRTFHCSSTH